MTTIVAETAEAICGGLHASDFEFVSEVTTAHGLDTYWHIGAEPQDLRVVVRREEALGLVTTTIQWRIIKVPPRVVKTSIELRIDTTVSTDRSKLMEATTAAVHKCLEVYRDVLEGSGYASAQYLATHERVRFN